MAIILQIVKGTSPVRAHRENINVKFFNIIKLLALCLFSDDLICKTCLLHVLNTRSQGIHHIQFPPGPVICLRSDTYNQIVSQSFCPLKQPIVPFMEKVKCTICNYFYNPFSHKFPLFQCFQLKKEKSTSSYPKLENPSDFLPHKTIYSFPACSCCIRIYFRECP